MSKENKKPPTYPLHPIKTNNTRALRLTATAGTKLVGASSRVKVIFLISRNHFTENWAHSSWSNSHWVKLAFIAQDSSLLPPVGARTLSQFRCGWLISQTNYALSPWWAVIKDHQQALKHRLPIRERSKPFLIWYLRGS